MEYFLLASYSCLPSVVTRLEQLREEGQTAVLFCLTQPLYQFLKLLSPRYTWIKVHYVDTAGILKRSLRNPAHWWQTRRDVKSLYLEWFSKIPAGQVVHFYNRYAALFLFYVVWHLKDNQVIHYTASDPAGLHPESRRLFSQIQKLIFQLIYSVPLKIVESAGRKEKTWPALTDQALTSIIDVECSDIYAIKDVRASEVFQVLSWHSKSQVLWVMGLVLDMDEVSPSVYSEVLKQCVEAVNSIYVPAQQAVKFHPRARKREAVWSSAVEYVSGYVPAEFINLPDLKVVLTISSTAVSMLEGTSNVKVISLVELIPFRDEGTRDAHRRLAHHFGSDIMLLMPASIGELENCLKSALEPHAMGS